MELIQAYLYLKPPIETDKIHPITIRNLKSRQWYKDTRGGFKFIFLNKRIEVNNQWYRVMIRLEIDDSNGLDDKLLKLSDPFPFIITECERYLEEKSGDVDVRFKDIKTYHGKKLKGISGYISEGIPMKLIDYVYQDLKDSIMYQRLAKIKEEYQ